jgi:hypothetical protein
MAMKGRRPEAGVVDGLGDEFFACTAFALDEDGGAVGGDFGEADAFFHGGLLHDVFEAELGGGRPFW